jgi:hypothetical protein
MTIRQYLRALASRYVNRLMIFLIIAGAMMAISTDIFVIRFAFAVVMLVVVIAAVVHLFQVPCPSCRKSLGRTGFLAANAGGSNSEVHCPHCGVNFDSEMPRRSDQARLKE